MIIYIDESGNLGQNSKSRFFVITAIYFLNEKRVKNIIKRYKAKKQIREIKGSLLDFRDRQFLLNKLCDKDDYQISYIVLDKKNMTNTKLFEDNNILFNYLCSFLFKNVVMNTHEDIQLCFDNRTVKVASGNSLSDYIKIKAYAEWDYKMRLSVSYVDSKSHNCIQMVDLVSNTIYRSYVHGMRHLYNILKIKDSILFPPNNFGQ